MVQAVQTLPQEFRCFYAFLIISRALVIKRFNSPNSNMDLNGHDIFAAAVVDRRQSPSRYLVLVEMYKGATGLLN